MSFRFVSAAFAFTAVAAMAGGCLSPTLPLPPPVASDIQSAAGGEWTVSGTCNIGGDRMIVSDESQGGQGVSAFCDPNTRAYSILIKAAKCDRGIISEEHENEVADSDEFLFQPTSDSFPDNSCPH